MLVLRLRDAQIDDLDDLVSMNAELIEDEAYDAPLPLEEIEDRMRGFLRSHFRIFMFLSGKLEGEIVGYAIVDVSQHPHYLRHFYISRTKRRQGYGRTAFALICETLGVEGIDVEVMAWNETGKRFWRSLGFKHRYEGLRWTAPGAL